MVAGPTTSATGPHPKEKPRVPGERCAIVSSAEPAPTMNSITFAQRRQPTEAAGMQGRPFHRQNLFVNQGSIVLSEPRGRQKSDARYRHRYRIDLLRYVTENCCLVWSFLILAELVAEPGCPVNRLRSQYAFQVPSAAAARRAWDGKLVRGWLIRQANKMRAFRASYPQPIFPPRRFHAAPLRSLKKTTRFRIVLRGSVDAHDMGLVEHRLILQQPCCSIRH
jgi:hypothetical protein